MYRIRDLQRAQQRPDPPGAAAERVRHRAAAEQVWRELSHRFPVLSAENFAEANRWGEQRLAELLAQR